jgi:hypothetical protein
MIPFRLDLVEAKDRTARVQDPERASTNKSREILVHWRFV